MGIFSVNPRFWLILLVLFALALLRRFWVQWRAERSRRR
jgi:hypothetical protein